MANYDITTYWSCHGMWWRRPVVPNISLFALPESCLLSQSCSWNLQCVTQSFRLCSLQSFCWEVSFHCCSKNIFYRSFYWHLTQFPASHKALPPPTALRSAIRDKLVLWFMGCVCVCVCVFSCILMKNVPFPVTEHTFRRFQSYLQK